METEIYRKPTVCFLWSVAFKDFAEMVGDPKASLTQKKDQRQKQGRAKGRKGRREVDMCYSSTALCCVHETTDSSSVRKESWGMLRSLAAALAGARTRSPRR